jgi:hypothetical protein
MEKLRRLQAGEDVEDLLAEIGKIRARNFLPNLRARSTLNLTLEPIVLDLI